MLLLFSCVKKRITPPPMGVFQISGKFFSKNFQVPQVVGERNL